MCDWCAIKSIWELLSLLYRDHDSYALAEDPFFDIPVEVGDYNLFNLRTGVRGDRFDFTVFVENLFDERFNVESNALGTAPAPFIGDTLVVPGKPRTFGVVATARF